jgi:hypothetical protein
MAIGWSCVIALALFADRPPPELLTDAQYERAIAALRKRPRAREELVAKCVRWTMAEIKEADLRGTSYSDRAAMAKDICQRFFKVMLDGRLTLAEINRLGDSGPLKLIEEAERRQPRFRDE